MRITSFNAVTFASLNMGAGTPRGEEAGPDLRAMTLSRRGYAPLHIGVARDVKTLLIDFIVKPSFDVEGTMLTLLGSVNPYDERERVLGGQLNDGTPVQCYAALGSYFWSGGNRFSITFTVADPVWRKPTATTVGPQTWPYAGGNMLEVPNAGKARANLALVIKPTAYDPGPVGFKYRRQFTVTNTSDTPLRQFPYEVDLGNSNGWGNTVSANASKTWVFRDGLWVGRELIGWSEIQSWVWILIDDLAAGASATYDICWEGLTDSPGLTGNRRPAFDITWEKNNATGGSTNTIVKSSAAWRVNQWRRGQVNITSGLGSGQSRKILSNTATTLTTETNWTTAPDATSVFIVSMSHNDRWVYDVSESSRSNSNRGLWYQNKGQTKPSQITFDTPGAWYRTLIFDNNDEKNQSRTFPIDVGGGDIDYFNGLDADRTAQGWTKLQESGQADGVAFSSPIEIDGWRFDYGYKNPNALTKATFGFRESGAEGWEEQWTDSGAYAGLTTSGISDTTFTTDVRHLAAYLGPVNDEEITPDWVRDTGTASSSTTTTLTDATKSWATNQFAGAVCKIVGGTGINQTRTVTSNTATTLTLSAAWTTNLADDSKFEVKNPKLVATLRHATTWEVRLNTTKITQSAIGAQITNYNLIDVFTLGGGPALVTPYQRVTLSANSRQLHVGSTEELRIDGARRRAGVYTTSSGAFVRDVTNSISVQDVLSTGTYLAPDWLDVPPNPASPFANPDFPTGITGWIAGTATAGVTFAASWDGTLGHLANGSLRIQVTASTAAVGAFATARTLATMANVIAGRQYTLAAWGRSDNRNWLPLLALQWQDAGGTNIGGLVFSTNGLAYVPTTNTWSPIGFSAVAPATATQALVYAYGYQNVASSIGSVWYDEFRWDTSALFEATQSSGVTWTLTASLVEGFYG